MLNNNWFLGILLGVILVAGVFSTSQIFADDDKEKKFKEKIDKIKDKAKKAPKDKKSKDRVEFEKDDTNSKKISKVLTKSIKNQKDRQEFGVLSLDEEGKTRVYLHLTDKEDLSEIPSQYEIIDHADNIVVAKLSLDEMNEIAALDIVKTIGPLQRAVFYTHQVSEGVANTFADSFHASGIDGTGVTVAVIDGSFHITDPEIAPNIISSQLLDVGGVCSGDIACGDAPGDSHGTAVAEIIVDMAPNVNLKLYAIGTSVDFNNAVDDAIANGADIITASLGFPTVGGDGVTGSFRDGTSVVAKKVNDANAAGLLFTVAAGNEGTSHWMGNYVPSPVTPVSIGLSALNESVMDFQPGATGSQRACMPVTDIGDLYVTSWDDWAVSFNDYDLYLFDSTMTTVLAAGFDDQTAGGQPIEFFFGTGAGSACLVLASWETSENHFFHIDTESNSLDPSFRMREGSIGTPADATGSFSVGAMDVGVLPWDIESFSSAGPTDDGRGKPEICSFDGTFSHSNFNPFYGTSASTPHVAGAAALLLHQNPSISNTQIKNDLMGAAVNGPGNFAVPNLCGSGQMNLATLLISPPSIIIGNPSEGSTIEGSQRFGKIIFSGFVDNLITGINDVTLTLRNSSGVVVYNSVVPVDSFGFFDNEFDSPLFSIDFPGTDAYELTVTYDTINAIRNFNYVQLWDLSAACATHDFCTYPFDAFILLDGNITYYNADIVPHSITSGVSGIPDGLFDSGILQPDGSTNMNFPSTSYPAGVYPFFDSQNIALTGTITIQESVFNAQATGQVTILGGTCGLSFPDGSSINYGVLSPDQLSPEITLNMTNTGSIIALLEVHGTDWQDISANSIMDANRTHFNVTSGEPYSSNIHLESFDQTVTSSFLPSVLLQTFWQVEAILNQAFSGDVTQTMDFTVSC